MNPDRIHISTVTGPGRADSSRELALQPEGSAGSFQPEDVPSSKGILLPFSIGRNACFSCGPQQNRKGTSFS